MYIKIDEQNYLTEFTLIETKDDMSDYIFINSTDIKEHFNDNEELDWHLYAYWYCYKYVNNKIIKDEVRFSNALNKEQRQHWLNKCLEVSKKIEEYKMLGFEGRQELVDLENKLQEYKLKYSATFESEAIAMDKHMSSTKPVK